MGLDTFIYRSTLTTEKTSDYFDNYDNWSEVCYWRKCYGIDKHLRDLCIEMIDENSGLISCDDLLNMYEDACERAAKIVKMVNKNKEFPFINIETIHELDDYSINLSEYDALENAVRNIAGPIYADSFYGPIHTLSETIRDLRCLLRSVDYEQYDYLFVSSY